MKSAYEFRIVGFAATPRSRSGHPVPGVHAGPSARCEASKGCIGCLPGLSLRDWKSPNPQSSRKQAR